MADTPTLGKLLRDLRHRFGWTLKEMSARSGIPMSTLAKVEQDRLTLTYDKLQQLSRRLDIRLSDLFAKAEGIEEVPFTARRSIGRIEDAVRVNTPQYDYYYLCTELRRKRMIPVIGRIRAQTLEQFGELIRHQGEEFIYVLQGTVEVHTEFYDPVVLEEGEFVYIDSTMGHAYIAAEGCEEAVILACNSSAEEGLADELINLGRELERVKSGAAAE